MKWLLRYPMATAAMLAFLILIALSLVIILSTLKHQTIPVESKTIALQNFHFVLGGGRLQNEVLEIDRYTSGRAIISIHQGMADAGKYRYLAFNLSSARLNEDLPLFFWRTADAAQLHTAPLEENVIDHLDLQRYPQWHGRISEFGFMFEENTDQSWYLSEVVFNPDTWQQRLQSMLSDWLEFEVWAQHSAHYINGGAANKHWSLGILVAGWVFLSLMLYWSLVKIADQSVDSRQVAAMLLLGWMLLDARWLYNLLQQAQVTHEVYAGKSLEQKYQSSMDADYYTYFQRLMDQVLPAEPQILYVLDNETDYYRAKVPWLLAPHNVFNLDQYPRQEYAAKGGYLLILEKIPGLWFDQITRALRWGKNGLLPVEPVDQDAMGVLYRITQ